MKDGRSGRRRKTKAVRGMEVGRKVMEVSVGTEGWIQGASKMALKKCRKGGSRARRTGKNYMNAREG